jgi:hypothetical protein
MRRALDMTSRTDSFVKWKSTTHSFVVLIAVAQYGIAFSNPPPEHGYVLPNDSGAV